MNWLISILLFSTLISTPEQETSIEIFLFEEECVPIEMVKGPQSFFNIWYSEAFKVKPSGVPLLTRHDIQSFDKEKFEIVLTESGKEVMESIQIPTNGIPVQLVVDGKVAYGAWLWTPLSSLMCDGVSFHYFGGEPSKLSIRDHQSMNERRIPRSMR